MTAEPSALVDEQFPFGAGRAVSLGASGLRAPRRWLGGERYVAYRDVTHLVVGRRTVRVATLGGVLVMPRARFGAPGALAFARALLARIEALPDGAERVRAFEQLDRKLLAARPLVATVLAVICVALYAIQQIAPSLELEGVYRASALRDGELWRLVTAQFLHANPVHLTLNVIVVLALGGLLERAVGRAATLFVVGVAAAGTMLGCRLAGYQEVLGISGIASGLVGAFLAFELAHPERMPAPVRVPRGILLGAIALEVGSDLWMAALPRHWAPQIATYAHAGGFAAGALAALALRDPITRFVRAGAVASAFAGVAAFVWLGATLAQPGDALTRHANLLLQSGAGSPTELNNLAWEIATSRRPSKDALAAAEQLAARAVAGSRRSDPNILDTLAETYFAQGRAAEAIDTIDEAIALAPGEPYFEEQRRRFTGERRRDDRPEAPAEPRAPGEGPVWPVLPPGDEVTV